VGVEGRGLDGVMDWVRRRAWILWLFEVQYRDAREGSAEGKVRGRTKPL